MFIVYHYSQSNDESQFNCRLSISVLEDFIGPERLSTMIAGSVKVKKQAKRARTESKDIIVATPGRILQLIANNIIRYFLES